MKNTIYLCLLILYSCSKKIECEKVSIEYNNKISLDSTSFISINNKKIWHTNNNKLIRYKKALPASYINMFGTTGNPIVFESDKQLIIEQLKQILYSTSKYKFDSLQFSGITDRLILSRKDNKNISIFFSKNYPATIKCTQ